MFELMTGGSGPLYAIGAAIATLIGVFLAGRRAGRNAERVKDQKRELTEWSEYDDLMAKGERARRAVEHGSDADLMHDDGHKRS